MSRLAQLRHGVYGALAGNVAARLGALGSALLATVVLAWQGGPGLVGVYALLHVLPGMLGTVASCGLTVSAAYFLAGPHRDDRRLPLTLVAMALSGGTAGAALWAAASPLLGPVLFPDLSLGLVLLAGAAVLTRVVVITAKSCCQGSEDLPGSNLVILTEELMFLPAYGTLWAVGTRGAATVVAALIAADCATAALAWRRLLGKGFLRRAAPPSLRLARRIAAYGLRAQVGGLISQLNLRLDYIVLTLFAGPAVLGGYAVASKFAELIKLVGMALTYVLYPKFARDGPAKAAVGARRVLPRAALLTVALAVPLWSTAGLVVPGVYGASFEAAVTPARIILLGLLLEGVAGVITAFLYGAGRPGLNSWAMAAGLVATVLLDLLLIPPFGAVGAAAASAVAYTTSTLVLIWLFARVTRRAGRAAKASGQWEGEALPRAAAR
ncbi:MAG: polysaccharide biosynthesis C-terminal domain-containing protein [Thermoleophilaceae bacterium]|nr:polysaccharide biosynthesis C-terminal domain-containing protein [Thermoleophilaceae bacterium]